MANIGLGLDPTRDIEGTRQVMQDRIWVKEANGLKQSLTAELEAVDAEAQMIAREAKGLLDEGNIRGSVERSMDAHNERYAKRMQVIAQASAKFGNNPHAKPLLETALTKAQGEHQAVLQMVDQQAAQMEQMFAQDEAGRGPIDPQDVAGMDPAEEQELRQESPQSFTDTPEQDEDAAPADVRPEYRGMVDKGLPNPETQTDQSLVKELRALSKPWKEGDPARYDSELVGDAFKMELERRGVTLPDFRYENYLEDKGLPVPSEQTDDELIKELVALREGEGGYDSEIVQKAFEREAERRGLDVPGDYDDPEYRQWLRDQEID